VTDRSSSGRGVAHRLVAATRGAFGLDLPLALRAWDGSRAGPPGGPVVVLRSPRAVRHLVRSPGELGFARAFVAGDLDVEGDLRAALRGGLRFVEQVRAAGAPPASAWPGLVALAIRLGALGPPPPVPEQEARLRGRRHSRDRDRAAIAHHYDLGNDFYSLLLDPTMAYSCAYWPAQDTAVRGPAAGAPSLGDAPVSAFPAADLAATRRQALEQAQRTKLDLVCRRLQLRPGARLLDVGCGWGSLVLHAAERLGVHATGLTISARQADFVREQAQRRGMEALVDVQVRDYRDSTGRFDAVASIEMGEHVGDDNYPEFTTILRDRLEDGGRLLVQQMCRGDRSPGGGPFIESYIAPDMAMRPLHRTLAHIEDAGLEIVEIEAMRMHYARTVEAWAHRLDDVWDDVVHRFGSPRARIWRLYLAGGALAFADNRMGVHQVLAVRSAAGADPGIQAAGTGVVP